MRCQLIAFLIALAGLISPAGAIDLSPAEIQAARKVYEVKCAKCHKFYEPAVYSDGDWSDWMNKMSKKSKLKKEQERVLRAYLDDYRKNGKFADR